MDVDAQGYVTWVEGADAAAFAKLARAYAAEKNLADQGQKTAEKKDDSNITTVTFDNLDLGYYLVDSTLGTPVSYTHLQQVAGSSPFASSIFINMGRFPSGQREQTVNLPSQTSVVRIHPCPSYICGNGGIGRRARFRF